MTTTSAENSSLQMKQSKANGQEEKPDKEKVNAQMTKNLASNNRTISTQFRLWKQRFAETSTVRFKT